MHRTMSGLLHRPAPWLTATLLLVVQLAGAQSKADRALHSVGPAAETVCVLSPVLDDSGARNLPDPQLQKMLAPTSTFSVTYVDEDPADPWPDAARQAVEYAVSIWASTIVSPLEVRIKAYWADRGGCSTSPVVLGSAGPRALHRDHAALPLSDTWYVDALADALTGLDMGGSHEPDIRIFLNRDCDNQDASSHWYFGIDGNPPAGHIDLVSVVLHEVGHGLGISGAGRVTSGSGTVRYSTRPYVYDRFTVDGAQPSSPLLSYPDFSTELGSALQAGSGAVLYQGASANASNGGVAPSLYAPDPWKAGSSYSHLDEQTYNNTTNALMTPMLSTMEANHVVGPVTCGLLEDMGWTVSSSACDLSLPVELAEFSAVADGQDIILQWRTVSEKDNLGFEIQHRRPGGTFEALDFVPGSGTTAEPARYEATLRDMEPGEHDLRLRQLDVDGRSSFSPVVSARVQLVESFQLTEAYPNPFNPVTQFSLRVRETEWVHVEVVDMLGRSVATLFSGVAGAGEQLDLRFDAEMLPSGVYVYRAVGETFIASRTAILMR